MSYKKRKVLVTGGLGFIGSNLSLRLVEEGARVTIVDSAETGCGANPFNIEPVRDRVTLLPFDIGEPESFHDEVGQAEVIFNLAGEISHVHGMELPERDLAINTLAQLRFLLACRDHRPGVRIIYAGTRQVYGVPEYLPVDESHPVQPVDFNGVHKYAATMYHLMLSAGGEMDAVVLRLTNVYGPRMALDVPCQGFLSTFLRRLLHGQTLEVFGDGRQLRDPVFVDDVVDAMLAAGAVPRLASRSYNVGGPAALSLMEMAEIMSRETGVGPPALRPFPEGRKTIDIGSYYTDASLIEAELGWRPKTTFESGLRRTLAYYAQHRARYLDVDSPNPHCKLDHAEKGRRKMVFAAV